MHHNIIVNCNVRIKRNNFSQPTMSKRNKKQPMLHDKAIILKAIEEVRLKKKTVKCVAKNLGINRASVYNFLRKYKDVEFENIEENIVNNQKRSGLQVFTPKQEEQLTAQILNSPLPFLQIEISKIIYQFAISNDLNIPSSWIINEKTGTRWLRLFLKRHPELSSKVMSKKND